MRRPLLLLGIFLALFCAAFAARMAFVPDVVAVAYEEAPQSVWALETSFVLQSIENVALAGAALMLALVIGLLVWPMIRRAGSR
jgi:parvulin-like peptidyl-prolyl isomerase